MRRGKKQAAISLTIPEVRLSVQSNAIFDVVMHGPQGCVQANCKDM
jgi:hypothetical protein